MEKTAKKFMGFGLGLRHKYFDKILSTKPNVDWFEIISENFMGDGGRPMRVLRQILERYPVVMHGVSLSIGTTDTLNKNYLKSLKKLERLVNPPILSDHLCFTGAGGHNAHDLLPLPYNEKTLNHVVKRVKRVQDFLGRQIALENVSSYMTYKQSTMPEWEFVSRVAHDSDSLILLDINNIYVSAKNHDFNALDYLLAIPEKRVAQFHLAGHTKFKTHILDTHDHPICSEVWALYVKAVSRFGEISTLIERDDRLPAFNVLLKELNLARSFCQKGLQK